MGDPFNPKEYQGKFVGFVGDRITGVKPWVILVEDTVWDWTKARVVKDVVELAAFFGDESNRGLMYVPTSEDTQVDTEAPMLLLIPAGLVEWMLAIVRTT